MCINISAIVAAGPVAIYPSCYIRRPDSPFFFFFPLDFVFVIWLQQTYSTGESERRSFFFFFFFFWLLGCCCSRPSIFVCWPERNQPFEKKKRKTSDPGAGYEWQRIRSWQVIVYSWGFRLRTIKYPSAAIIHKRYPQRQTREAPLDWSVYYLPQSKRREKEENRAPRGGITAPSLCYIEIKTFGSLPPYQKSIAI